MTTPPSAPWRPTGVTWLVTGPIRVHEGRLGRQQDYGAAGAAGEGVRTLPCEPGTKVLPGGRPVSSDRVPVVPVEVRRSDRLDDLEHVFEYV